MALIRIKGIWFQLIDSFLIGAPEEFLIQLPSLSPWHGAFIPSSCSMQEFINRVQRPNVIELTVNFFIYEHFKSRLFLSIPLVFGRQFFSSQNQLYVQRWLLLCIVMSPCYFTNVNPELSPVALVTYGFTWLPTGCSGYRLYTCLCSCTFWYLEF